MNSFDVTNEYDEYYKCNICNDSKIESCPGCMERGLESDSVSKYEPIDSVVSYFDTELTESIESIKMTNMPDVIIRPDMLAFLDFDTKSTESIEMINIPGVIIGPIGPTTPSFF